MSPKQNRLITVYRQWAKMAENRGLDQLARYYNNQADRLEQFQQENPKVCVFPGNPTLAQV